MSRLASDYGITGNGLAKICDRLSIPLCDHRLFLILLRRINYAIEKFQGGHLGHCRIVRASAACIEGF
jgi:hypothetical protein